MMMTQRRKIFIIDVHTPPGSNRPLFNQEKPLRELKEERGNPAHIGGEIQRERDSIKYEKQDLFGNFLSSQQVF